MVLHMDKEICSVVLAAHLNFKPKCLLVPTPARLFKHMVLNSTSNADWLHHSYESITVTAALLFANIQVRKTTQCMFQGHAIHPVPHML